MRTAAAREVLNFASAHPQLEEFSWQSAVPYDFIAPTLLPRFPRLVRLVQTSHVFIQVLLSLPRTPGSLALEELEEVELSAETLPLLHALRGDALRSLTLASLDSKQTLFEVGQMFPNLRRLRIVQRFEGDQLSIWEVARVFPQLVVFANATSIYTLDGAQS